MNKACISRQERLLHSAIIAGNVKVLDGLFLYSFKWYRNLMQKEGLLSVVATPIGNLEDITYRAVTVLSQADYILCEDTRVTGKLRQRYNIETPLKKYDAHVSDIVHQRILDDLKEGKHLALVSDAGTPGVSDPGVLLVSFAREAGILIDAIPGPSAVTTAFSIAGVTGNQFAFLGFVPHKKGRETFFKSLASRTEPAIFFESTHRIMKTLEALNSLYPEVGLIVARELTKLHEEVITGTPKEIFDMLSENQNRQKGEFVVIFNQ